MSDDDFPPMALTHGELLEIYREAAQRGHMVCVVTQADDTKKWALLYKRKRKPTPFGSIEEVRAALGVLQ